MGTQDGYKRTEITVPGDKDPHIVLRPDGWQNIRELAKALKEKFNEYFRNKKMVPKDTQVSSRDYYDLYKPGHTITIIASENNPNNPANNWTISNYPGLRRP